MNRYRVFMPGVWRAEWHRLAAERTKLRITAVADILHNAQPIDWPVEYDGWLPCGSGYAEWSKLH